MLAVWESTLTIPPKYRIILIKAKRDITLSDLEHKFHRNDRSQGQGTVLFGRGSYRTLKGGGVDKVASSMEDFLTNGNGRFNNIVGI